MLAVITQSRVWKRSWSCCIHCWDKYEVRDSAPHCWGKAGPVSGLLSQYFPQHIPPRAPLFPRDLLSAHFLSACYCTCSASLTSGPAISHRWVNCCWPRGLSSTKCPLCTAHSGGATGCWNVTRRTVFTLLLFSLSSECVRERVRVLTGYVGWWCHKRTPSVFPDAPKKLDLWIWGDSYMLGEGQRRTAALCAGAVNRRFMSLLFTFESVSLACGHEGHRQRTVQGPPAWVDLQLESFEPQDFDELSGANSFSFRKNFRKSSLCPILHWVLKLMYSHHRPQPEPELQSRKENKICILETMRRPCMTSI